MDHLKKAVVNTVEAFTSCSKRTEGFDDEKKERRQYVGLVISELLLAVAIFLLVLLFGRALWNNFAVKYITILKPVDSIWSLLALMVLFGLMMP